MKETILRHRKLFGIAGMVIGITIAIIYMYFPPSEAARTQGIQQIILTYGHSVVWLLLASSYAIWGVLGYRKVAASIGYSALLLYGIFVYTLVTV